MWGPLECEVVKGVGRIPLGGLFLGAAMLLVMTLYVDGVEGSETVVEGTWVIDEPTFLSNGTWVVRNGTLRIESTLDLNNITLVMDGEDIFINRSARLRVRDSLLTAEGPPGLKIENRGDSRFFGSKLHNISSYGFSQPNGTLVFEDCEFRNGYKLLTISGDLVMRNCTVNDITNDILRIWTSDGSGRPTTALIESVVFADVDDIDYTEIAIEIYNPTAYQDDCDITVRDCRFEGFDLAVHVRDVWGRGSVTIEGNTGVDCGVSLLRCGDAVTSHHNRWGSGIYFGTSTTYYPNVHNETVVGGSTGMSVYSKGVTIDVWDVTILGSQTGFRCNGGTVHIHSSKVLSAETDWSISTQHHDFSRIFLFDTIHNGTANVGTAEPDCGVYELTSMRFAPVSWQGLVTIGEGEVEFLNETGEGIGSWDISKGGPIDLPLFEASTIRNVTCSRAMGVFVVEGTAFESQLFDLNPTVPVPLTFTDDSDPEVEIGSPKEGVTMNGYQLEVVGVVSEVGSGLSSLSVRMDLGQWHPVTIPSGSVWRFTFDHVPDGVHILSASAVDRVGNRAMAFTYDVTIDSVPPPILVISPGPRVNHDLVRMVISTEIGAIATVAGVPVRVNQTGGILTWVNLTEEVTFIVIRVRDAAGNVNETVYRIEIDRKGPGVVVEDPLDGAVTNASQVLVQGYTEVDAIVTVNDRPAERDDEWFSLTLEAEEGVLEIVVVATDVAGNPTVVRHSLFVDMSSPRLMVLRPRTAQYNTTDPDLAISGTLVDLTDVAISVNGVEVSVLGMDWFVYVTLEPGVNELVLEAVDAAGNRNSTRLTVRLDQFPPVISSMLVWRDRTYNVWDSDIVVGSGHVTLRLQLNEIADVLVGGGPTDRLEAGTHDIEVLLEPGENTLVVDAADPLGNEAPRIVYNVYLDTQAPIADAGRTLSIGVGRDVLLDGTGSTDDHGIVKWVWTFEYLGKEVSLNGAQARFVFQEPGIHIVTLTVTDTVGNTASDEVKVVVEEETTTIFDHTWVLVAVLFLLAIAVYVFYNRHLEGSG
jgi:hypothetical protein